MAKWHSSVSRLDQQRVLLLEAAHGAKYSIAMKA